MWNDKNEKRQTYAETHGPILLPRETGLVTESRKFLALTVAGQRGNFTLLP